jgi:hypothetical protein
MLKFIFCLLLIFVCLIFVSLFNRLNHLKMKQKEPLPSKVRIAKKSLEHSLEVLERGDLNPSGKGSRTYHEENVENKEKFLAKWGHLADVWIKGKGKPK